MRRSRRELFNKSLVKRLAALGYLGGQPGLDTARILTDYVGWERHPLLRRWAQRVLATNAFGSSGTPRLGPHRDARWRSQQLVFYRRRFWRDHERTGAVPHRLQRSAPALLVDRTGQLRAATVGERPNFSIPHRVRHPHGGGLQRERSTREADWRKRLSSRCSTKARKSRCTSPDIARRVILVVLFDNRTTLGLVRLKMLKPTVMELTQLFEKVLRSRPIGQRPRTCWPGPTAMKFSDKLFQ